MGILDSIKNAVWEDGSKGDGKPASKTSQTPPARNPAPAQATTLPARVPVQGEASVTIDAGASDLDVTAVAAQIETIVAGNPGFAVAAKFLENVKNLMPVLKAEPVAYVSALATSGGVDQATLLESVNTYQGVLDGEKTNFAGQYVSAAQTQIDALNAEATSLDQQINDLAQQLGQLNEKRQQLTATAQEKATSLAKAQIDFDGVVKAIDTKYADIANKVTKFLGAQQ